MPIRFLIPIISRCLLAASFALFHCIALAHEPIYFSTLTVEDGLSNSSVLSVMQDSRGFMWLGTRDGLNRYDGLRMKTFRSFFNKSPLSANSKINCITEDENKDLWIGTSKGLYIYKTRVDSFQLLLSGYVNTIFKDAGKDLWIGTTNGFYLHRHQYKSNQHLTYLKYESVAAKAFDNVQCIVQEKSGRLVLGTADGLFFLEKMSNHRISVFRPMQMSGINIITVCIDSFQNIWMGSNKTGLYKANPSFSQITNYVAGTAIQNIRSNNVRKVFADKKGNLWIGTLGGLNRYNPDRDGFDFWVHDPANSTSLNNNSIYEIYEDKQGSLWIGTYFGGVNIIEAKATHFEIYKNGQSENSLSSNIISAISESPNGNLWIGTEAEGLNLMDIKTASIKRFATSNKKLFASNLVKTLYSDVANTLWVGLYGGGINYTNNVGQNFLKLTTANSAINSNDITSIIADEKQRLWIGQQDRGINIISQNRKTIFSFNQVFPNATLIDSGITYLYKSAKNDLYIGARTGLFLCKNQPSDKDRIVKKIFPEAGANVYVNCIVEDSSHRIWIGSTAGLCLYNPMDNQFTLYTTKDGLPTNRIVGIVPDNKDNLWLSTYNGISRWKIASGQITNYSRYDGLPSSVFNYNSFYKTKNGHIFFGSLNGLVSFLPSEITQNAETPLVGLEALSVAGKNVAVGDSTGILTYAIGSIKNITLQHDQSDIAIDYAVLNFIKPHKNTSAYMLKGYNTNWVYTSNHQAVFNRLQPGTYTLLIKAANNDGLWSIPYEMLRIKVLPPLWKTWWAFLIYILVLLFGLRFFVRFYNSKQELKRQLQYEFQANLQQQELQKMKSDFFTYMSHELRTPLTLISGPAEMLADRATEGTVEKKLAESIKSNSDRMMALTNNLMDLMKADSGALKLNCSADDIVAFAKNVFYKFEIPANEKQLNYLFQSDIDEALVSFDSHYMEIVFTNLLSNAIKFTPQHGTVKMRINETENNNVSIHICDNGVGISKEDAGKIFDNFFQAVPEIQKQQGFGIGLALCKKLVVLQNGVITLSSGDDTIDAEMQTCFTVRFKKHIVIS